MLRLSHRQSQSQRRENEKNEIRYRWNLPTRCYLACFSATQNLRPMLAYAGVHSHAYPMSTFINLGKSLFHYKGEKEMRRVKLTAIGILLLGVTVLAPTTQADDARKNIAQLNRKYIKCWCLYLGPKLICPYKPISPPPPKCLIKILV